MRAQVTHGAWTMLGLSLGFAVGAMAPAVVTASDHVTVTQVSRRNIVEKIDGKESRATVEEVIIKAGQEDVAHRHSGPAFGYVVEGEYEHAIDDEPTRIYKAGETFYEPSGALHRVARNPSTKARTRLIALVLHPRDANDVTIREKSEK